MWESVMAILNAAALPALGTLVGAAVFSTSFLSARVHRERTRALDRALEIDELVAARRADAELVGRFTGIDPQTIDDQRAALEESLDDRLALLVLGMNVLIAIAAAGLAVLFGHQAGLTFTDFFRDPSGWALLAAGATALLVVGVGAFDVLAVRRQLRARLSDTVLGQTAAAGQALLRALKSQRASSRLALLGEAERRHAGRSAHVAAPSLRRGRCSPM
jgi:hypothetical protein